MVQGSPAGSGGEANSTVSGEEDKVSQSSTDSSRRLSELPNLEIPQVISIKFFNLYNVIIMMNNVHFGGID